MQVNAHAAQQDPLFAWIAELEAEEAHELLKSAASRSNEVYDWLDGVRAASSQDPGDLLAIVDRALKPTRRFYDYWQANDYAAECAGTVQLLTATAEQATPGLLPVIERAITLLTRAILKADDSSGMLGDLVREALDAHAAAVRTSNPALSPAEQKRLVKWIVKYRYGGTQDFFDPDIVAYAPGLSEASIEHYRQAIEATDLGEYGDYPLTRLAVLSGDRDAIVAANRGEPHNAMVARRLVDDLLEAGLHDDAVHYARVGIDLDDRGWDPALIDFLVQDALQRGETSDEGRTEAVRLRREWFERFTSAWSFEALRETADRVGLWPEEQSAAEETLAEYSTNEFARYLLKVRPDEAWEYALANVPIRVSDQPVDVPEGVPAWQKASMQAMLRKRNLATFDAHLWSELCKLRERTHPADVLPVYRDLIDETLVVTAKQSYQDAARLLKRLRTVAAEVGGTASAEFAAFLDDTVTRNKRRPNCIAAFKRAGLIS